MVREIQPPASIREPYEQNGYFGTERNTTVPAEFQEIDPEDPKARSGVPASDLVPDESPGPIVDPRRFYQRNLEQEEGYTGMVTPPPTKLTKDGEKIVDLQVDPRQPGPKVS